MAANRNFTSSSSFSFERMHVNLMGAFTQVGTAGSATYTAQGAVPMVLTRTGVGVYRIQLANTYSNLIGVSIMLQPAAGATDIAPQMASSTVSSDGRISFRAIDSTGAVAELLAGDVIYISLDLRNNPQS